MRFFHLTKLARLFILLAAVSSVFTKMAFADEFYGLQRESCDVDIGLIIRIEDGQISLLGLDGKLSAIPKTQVKTVFVFNTVESPITKIELTDAHVRQLKAIYVNSTERPHFFGWPIRFIDNLVVFTDLTGNSHVHDLEKILKIRTPEPADLVGVPAIAQGKRFAFDLRDFFPACPEMTKKPEGAEILRPTRILADEIRVRQFFDDLEHGYDDIENLQERTLFYARPFLYQDRPHLGLLYVQNPHEVHPLIPAFLSWSNGRPFRFQSATVIGANVHDQLPNQEPDILVKTDAKAHFFHAHFAGNLAAFAGGKRFFSDRSDFLFPKETRGIEEAEVQSTFNYMALMGADYGPFSLSAGKYFPVYGMKFFNESREVLATEATTLFRVQYMNQRLRLKATVAPKKSKSVVAPQQKDLLAKTYYSDAIPPASFHFESAFWRVVGEYEIIKNLTGGASFFHLTTDYKESRAGADNYLAFRRNGLTLSARQEFGSYISFSVLWNQSWNHYRARRDGKAVDNGMSYSQMGGTLEFIF